MRITDFARFPEFSGKRPFRSRCRPAKSLSDRRAPSAQEVRDNRDQCKDQKNVNRRTRDVDDQETQQPQDEKNYR